MIKDNLIDVEKRINDACKRGNRSVNDVRLIAVSKTKPEEDIMEAYNCGIRDFGENKVQELLRKKENLPSDIKWHMIGHLQTNKVRQIVGNAELIHSIDTIKLADAIEAESIKKNVITEGLLEINVANEDSKYGFTPDLDPEIFQHISKYTNLRIRGLMTVAPAVEDPELNRAVFRQLKALAVDTKAKNIDNIRMDFLSMGMTGDYEIAIEEGATFVRIGTGIFGSRIYEVK